MWCPECNDTKDPELEICPECGAELREIPRLEWGAAKYGEVSQKWPGGGDGNPVPPAFLAHRSTISFEDEMLCNMLEAYGIPSFREYPNDGEFAKVIMGIGASGADIYVPETMLEDAVVLIREAEHDEEHIG